MQVCLCFYLTFFTICQVKIMSLITKKKRWFKKSGQYDKLKFDSFQKAYFIYIKNMWTTREYYDIQYEKGYSFWEMLRITFNYLLND